MKPEKDFIDRLRTISTPHIADAMAKLLSRTIKHQTLDSDIKPLCRSFKVCGVAYTVKCYPGATYAMEKAVAEAPAGTVIVCDGQSSDAGVLLGELMSTFAMQRGVAGAVVDGAVRDIDEIVEMGFPVFARHITPRNGTFEQLGAIGEIISCGSVVVSPGDFVCGDINGVVVIPQGIVKQVLIASEQLVRWETDVKKLILAGNTLNQAAQMCAKPAIQKI